MTRRTTMPKPWVDLLNIRKRGNPNYTIDDLAGSFYVDGRTLRRWAHNECCPRGPALCYINKAFRDAGLPIPCMVKRNHKRIIPATMPFTIKRVPFDSEEYNADADTDRTVAYEVEVTVGQGENRSEFFYEIEPTRFDFDLQPYHIEQILEYIEKWIAVRCDGSFTLNHV